MKRAWIMVVFWGTATGLLAAASPVYLPHLAVGGGMSSTVSVTNLFPDQYQMVSVRFYQENGLPWTVSTNIGVGASFELSVPFGAVQPLHLTSTATAIESGWAVVQGRDSVMVSAFYEYAPGTAVAATAGVIPCAADPQSILPVEIDSTRGVNTGLAVTNPSAFAAEIRLELFDNAGASLGIGNQILAPGAKLVNFINAISPFIGYDSLTGYLKVTATTPLAVMGMRTTGSLFTSLPTVHEPLPWRNSRTIFVSPIVGSDAAGDGSLLMPFRTIYRAFISADRGWTVYLLPGLYDASTGEHFPVALGYCITVRGAGRDLVYIRGGGVYANYGNIAVVAGFRGSLSDATVINPNGDGIVAEDDSTFVDCRATGCSSRGGRLMMGSILVINSIFTGNRIGLQVEGPALPDLGGGIMYGSGGNVFQGNANCDLFVNRSGLPSMRFNSWDTPVPTIATACSGGVDIATPFIPYQILY